MTLKRRDSRVLAVNVKLTWKKRDSVPVSSGFRTLLNNWETDGIFCGLTPLFLAQHEFVNAAEALLQTESPLQPDGAPHV